MSAKHDVQMFITVVLLAVAAACSLFQKDVSLTHVVELKPQVFADTSASLVLLTDVDTRTKQLIEYEGNIKKFELTEITVSVDKASGEMPQGEIAFAEAGSADFTVLGSLDSVCARMILESGEEKAKIMPDIKARQKLSKLIGRGSTITFRLLASADSCPSEAGVTMTIDSKMTVEI